LCDSEGGELELDITDVRVRKVGGDGKMKAVASVTFDNSFVVHDIKIIEGQKWIIHRYAKSENSRW
jgi:stage V sporulation protein G